MRHGSKEKKSYAVMNRTRGQKIKGTSHQKLPEAEKGGGWIMLGQIFIEWGEILLIRRNKSEI